jgi:hypothetical protein
MATEERVGDDGSFSRTGGQASDSGRLDADAASGTSVAVLNVGEIPGHVALTVRLLLASLVLQAVAPAARLIQPVEAWLSDPSLVQRPFEGSSGFDWITAGLSIVVLALLSLATAGLARRHQPGRPIGWLTLGAAVAAQAFLACEAVLNLAQHALASSATGPSLVDPSPGPVWLDPTLNLVVSVLSFFAYLTFRSAAAAAAAASEPDPARPMAVRRGRLASVVLGVVAVVLVSAGSVAAVTQPRSSIGCADVTRQVGIEFRGAIGNTVIPGSDESVSMQQNLGNGAAVGDYDRDGNLDLYLLGQPGHPNRLYRNDHTGSGEGFTDVTAAAGLGELSGSRVAQFVDLDNDGLLDLVVANDYLPGTSLQPSRIYRNLGAGTFGDVTSGSGFNPVGLIVGGLGVADYNRDGLPDIYVAYWTGGMGMNETYASHNLLFENLGGFRFEDVTERVGLGSLSTGSFTPLFADLNQDGWPDLYIAIDGAPEALFVNDHGTFRDATAESGLGTERNGMGAALVDLQGAAGGAPSVYVTNITDPELNVGIMPGGNALLLARLRPGGALAYTDDAAAVGVRDAGWAWGATFTDLNLDGSPDLFVAQGMHAATQGLSSTLTNDRAYVFLGTTTGRFEPSTDNGCDIPGDQRAVVAFDYNRDGRPDLLVSQVAYDDTLLENRSDRDGHWLTVVAKPTAGRTVIGATITVTAGGQRWVQRLIGGGSYLAGPPNEGYFGLGSADRATSVAIDWPDGTTTVSSDVPADQLIVMQPPP